MPEEQPPYSAARKAECPFCRLDMPMSEIEPHHLWYDPTSDRRIVTRCYYEDPNAKEGGP